MPQASQFASTLRDLHQSDEDAASANTIVQNAGGRLNGRLERVKNVEIVQLGRICPAFPLGLRRVAEYCGLFELAVSGVDRIENVCRVPGYLTTAGQVTVISLYRSIPSLSGM